VEAGRRYGIPVTGTVAHSFIQAFANELEAFRAFAGLYPDTTLLVDTYDTPAAVETVIALARELGADFRVRAIRLDSGDLLALSRDARRRLDAAGLPEVRIIASGGLDEWKIDRLMRAKAPIDAFGVGTDMLVSTDAPALDIAYKLTFYDGQGRMKFSPGKRNLPGSKQVFRRYRNNRAIGDVLARHNENLRGRPLLETVMVDGRRAGRRSALADIREKTRDAIAQLPSRFRTLRPSATTYPVAVSAALARFEEEAARGIVAALGDSREEPRSAAAGFCPLCGGPVEEEHGVFRCVRCGQVVETCCEGAPLAP
jgi:nicotinate phosphoribosyltransferase